MRRTCQWNRTVFLVAQTCVLGMIVQLGCGAEPSGGALSECADGDPSCVDVDGDDGHGDGSSGDVDEETGVGDADTGPDTDDADANNPPDGSTCSIGERRCDDAAIELCVDGTYFAVDTLCPGRCINGDDGPSCGCAASTDCPPTMFCDDAGACSARVCAGTSIICEGGALRRCAPDGSGFEVLRTCAAGCTTLRGEALCRCNDASDCDGADTCEDVGGLGVCLGDACEAGQTFCDERDIVVCSTSGRESARESCEELPCIDGRCSCGEDEVCPSGQHCASGSCVPNLCVPGTVRCTGFRLMRCDDRGASETLERQCGSGGCSDDGTCTCDREDQCLNGESCADGMCGCASDLYCGSPRSCCAEGFLCRESEVCDALGACVNADRCLPNCGVYDRCGDDGLVCCTAERPLCGPLNACVRSCADSRPACGEICCATGEVCAFDSCRPIGDTCTRFTDCDFGEYCESSIGACLPSDFPAGLVCTEPLDTGAFEAEIKWSHTLDEVISIPVVGDVTGDGVPNVVVNAARVGASDWAVGEIVILSGVDGSVIRRVSHNVGEGRYGSHGRSTIALGDVTGDGVLDIIYGSRPISGSSGPIVAINGQGERLWTSRTPAGNPVNVAMNNAAVTVARFGESPRVATIVGGMLLDSNGYVLWDAGGRGPAEGTNQGYTGGVAIVADLTGDGRQEIVTGRRAWTVDWTDSVDGVAPASATVTELWAHGVAADDGYVAVGDFDMDGRPEVVLVSRSMVRILDGATGELWCGRDPTGAACADDPSLRTQPVALPGGTSNNRGGPPTIADFDADGRAEIGVAGGYFYVVYDINRPGEDVVQPDGDPVPEPGQMYVRWQNPSRDLSSNATGSSVFDFQGDGAAEVIYADECYMRVYDGTDGHTLFEVMNSTGTILEYPLVVDVDGNGRSEIVIVANVTGASSNCNIPGYVARRGVYVYQDPEDRWVRTRATWNQHAYSINNIRDDGTVPLAGLPSWMDHNTFRANRQGERPFNAANPAVSSITARTDACPPDLVVNVGIENRGLAGVPVGLPVTLYRMDGGARVVATATVDRPILPGGREVVRMVVPVGFDDRGIPMDFRVSLNLEDEVPFVFDCEPSDAYGELAGVVCLGY